MHHYLYLSLIPEALLFSQLPPDKFGMYLATGQKRQIEGPAVFFDVDQSADLSSFRIEEARARCVAHADGSPRCSTYISVYNVLPRVPLSALRRGYLTTPAGLSLPLEPGPEPAFADSYHLYQELGPVYPRVATRLAPRAFATFVTNPSSMVSVPRIAFIDLKLGELALDPEAEAELPYQRLPHIRECLRFLRDNPERMTKIVNRGMRPDILFYLIRGGLYIGDGSDFRAFPVPSEDVLERLHQLWWHSAQAVSGY